MSQAELARFAAALADDPALADKVRSLRTAAEVTQRLRAEGFDVSPEEVERAAGLAAEQAAELADDQLDGVTGGSLLMLGIGAGLIAFCSLPAIGGGIAAVGLVVAKKLGAKID